MAGQADGRVRLTATDPTITTRRLSAESSGLMRTLPTGAGPDMIRVNSVYPTTVDTDMVQNDATYALFAPSLAEQDRTRRRVTERFQAINALPIRGWSRRTSPAPCSGWPQMNPATLPAWLCRSTPGLSSVTRPPVRIRRGADGDPSRNWCPGRSGA
jgi:NAD(P)-dependent dehydrogenase (short-subunit alcohol dehydrogenase family)